MRTFIILLLISLGLICIFYSITHRSTEVEDTGPLAEVSGSIASHSFTTEGRCYSKSYYFWVRGYNCTFEISSGNTYDFDNSVFSNSFQDKKVVTVLFDYTDSGKLRVRDAVIPVKGLRSEGKVYLDEKTVTSTGALAILYTGLVFLTIAAVLIIIRLVFKYA
jgi:hypothetical protein